MSNLTDIDVKNARPGEKPKKLTDGAGLFLLVTPKGGKWWRFRYRFDGKEKLISLGTYPNISLAAARALRDKAHQLLQQGKDPSAVRKIEKAERSIGKAMETAREIAEQKQAEGVTMPSVRYMMDGAIELWKGSNVMRLLPAEARFVANQLSVLVRHPNGVK